MATIDDREIEQIVAEVIRRVLTLSAAENPPVSLSSPKKAIASEVTEAGVLRLDDRVVTLASVDGRLAGKSKLIVAANAVITPAVRDELKRFRVQLEREPKDNTTGIRTSRPRCVINLTNDVDLRGVASELAETGDSLAIESHTDLGVAIRKLEGEIRKGDVGRGNNWGVLVTRNPEVALIQANRSGRLTAIQAGCRKRLPNVVKGTGANLLVIDPSGRGEKQLTDWLRIFAEARR